MRRGVLFSSLLHVGIVLVAYFHLWDLVFPSPPLEDTPIVVQLVNVAPETRATKLNDTPPKPTEKPEEKTVEAPKQPPKPEPPKPPPPAPPQQTAQAQPEPPKPEPPKPEPPKPETPPPPPAPVPAPAPKPAPPKPQPPPPQPPPPKPPVPQETQKKKQQEDQAFDALLKNLAKRNEAQPTDTPPKPNAPTQTAKASSQPIAPLGAQLTTNELDLVKQQIEACWNVPAGAKDAGNLRPEFRVYMNQDGTVRSAELLNSDRMSDPFFQAAADSARRALLNPRCQPLKLPPEKYDQWQTFTITFDPKDVT